MPLFEDVLELRHFFLQLSDDVVDVFTLVCAHFLVDLNMVDHLNEFLKHIAELNEESKGRSRHFETIGPAHVSFEAGLWLFGIALL